MNIETFKNFDHKERPSFSDFETNYSNYVSEFVSEFEDNTEYLFLVNQLECLNDHVAELNEIIKGIDIFSDKKKEYMQYLKNRILPFDFNEGKSSLVSNDFDIIVSDESKEYEYYCDYLNKKKATTSKILQFLQERIIQLQKGPEAASEPKPKIESTSLNKALEFLNHININRATEIDILNFIEELTNNDTEKLKLLAKDLEAFQIDFISNKIVDNHISGAAFDPGIISESFKKLEVMVLNKINVATTDRKQEPRNNFEKKAWFIVGLNIANGKIESLKKAGLGQNAIAHEIGLTGRSDRSHISSSYRMELTKEGKSSLNVFDFDWKIQEIYKYCTNKSIQMTPEFEKIAEKHL